MTLITKQEAMRLMKLSAYQFKKFVSDKAIKRHPAKRGIRDVFAYQLEELQAYTKNKYVPNKNRYIKKRERIVCDNEMGQFIADWEAL